MICFFLYYHNSSQVYLYKCVASVLAYRLVDCFILHTFQNSTSEKEFCSPFIIRKFDADKSISASYSVYVELQETVKCPDFNIALFIAFSLHYVFNLTYHQKVHDLLMFLQEVVFKLQDDKQRKSPALTSFTIAIAAAASKDEASEDWKVYITILQ